MSFLDLFNFERERYRSESLYFLDSVCLTSQLIEQIDLRGTEWAPGVIDGILCVETNGVINNAHVQKSKRTQQKLSRPPLKGLRKVHIRISGIQYVAHTLGLKSSIDYTTYTFNIVDPSDIERLSTASKLLNDRRENDWNTGCWLLYGISNDVRHYLFVYDGIGHSDEIDISIYEELKKMYGENYLKQFLK